MKWLMIFAMLLSQFSAPLVPAAHANPSGGTVTHGSATINGQGTSSVTINQSSNRAVINWNDFSVGKGETTTFVQPGKNSVAYNRVIGANPSQILGTVNANGKIILSNKNGVVFGKGSKVDAAGLVATTHDANSNEFMAGGKLRFNDGGNRNAAIVNEGNITIRDSGVAAFVAPNVRNAGVIAADLGTVAMGAANGFSLDLYGDKLVSFGLGDDITQTLTTADGTPVKALVENSGVVNAGGGTILLTARAARDVMNQAVNVTGSLKASSAKKQGGKIILSSSNAQGQASGLVKVEGGATLAATGKTTGGEIQVLGREVVVAKSTIDASGTTGGGVIRIGGDLKGANTLIASDRTVIGAEAKIKADVTGTKGRGGDIVIWSDGNTDYRGDISARAGSKGGDGGFVEVSGRQHLDFLGTVDLLAPKGKKGTLLLDPAGLIIGPNATQDMTCENGICAPDQVSSYLNIGEIEAMLKDFNVFIEADEIMLEGELTWNTNSMLALLSKGSILIDGGTIRNTFNDAEVVQGMDIPVLLLLRANSDNVDNDGYIHNAGNIDFSNSLGAISAMTDFGLGFFDDGAVQLNSNWEKSQNGTVHAQFNDYTLVYSLTDLEKRIATDPHGQYAMAGNFDEGEKTATKATFIEQFDGTLDGQYCALVGRSGCTIAGLEMVASGSSAFGLFGNVSSSGRLLNFSLSDANMQFTVDKGDPAVYAGMLAATFSGVAANVHVNGGQLSFVDDGGSVVYVGGLFGRKDTILSHGMKDSVSRVAGSSFDGQINVITSHSFVHAGGIAGLAVNESGKMPYADFSNTSVTGNIIAQGGVVTVGGFVGTMGPGVRVADSFAAAGIQLDRSQEYVAGGFIGHAVSAHLGSVYSTGDIDINFDQQGKINVGGLVGVFDDEKAGGGIYNSYSTSNIFVQHSAEGDVIAGGLVGVLGVEVVDSYAQGRIRVDTMGNLIAGGLVGQNLSSISGSFAAGRLLLSTASSIVGGGLVGVNDGLGLIQDSYAVGSVQATFKGKPESVVLGGLVGANKGGISQVFATGYVTSGEDIESGGLVGNHDKSGFIDEFSFYDVDTTGQSDEGKGVGLRTAELQSRMVFDSGNWSQIKNVSYPYLNWQNPGDGKTKLQVVSGYYKGLGGKDSKDADVFIQGMIDGNDMLSLQTGDGVYTGANGYYYFLLPAGSILDSGSQVATYHGGRGVYLHSMARDSISDIAHIYEDALNIYTQETTGTKGLFSDLELALGDKVDDFSNLFILDSKGGIGVDQANLHITWDGLNTDVHIDDYIDIVKGDLYLNQINNPEGDSKVVQDNYIHAHGVRLNIDTMRLEHASNNISVVSGSFVNLGILESNAQTIALGSLNGEYLLLGTNGNFVQDEGMFVKFLTLNNADGTYSLQNEANNVDYLDGLAGYVEFTNRAEGMTLGSLNVDEMYMSMLGSVVQSGSIIANYLYLTDGGSYNLSGVNNIRSLEAYVDSLTLNNGTTNLDVYGGSATGRFLIQNVNTLSLYGQLSAQGNGDSIVLSANNFVNDYGANALNAGPGRFLVWSRQAANQGSEINGQDYNFRQYNASYGSTTVLGSGSGFLYTVAPTVSTSLTGTVTKQYDATTTATLTGANFTAVSGAIAGDTVVLSNPVSGTYAGKDKGNHSVSVANSTISSATDSNGKTVYGYQVAATSSANIGTISARDLTIGGNFTVNDKQYDATTAAQIGTNNLQLIGIQNNEDVTLSAVAAFSSENASALSRSVSLLGSSLGGTADLSNYNLVFTNAPTSGAKINKRILTIGGNFTANDKQYDATTAAQIGTNNLALIGIQNNEDVTLSALAAFADANANAAAQTVSLLGSSLGGSANLNNYDLSFASAPTALAKINKRTLTISGNFDVSNSIYGNGPDAYIHSHSLSLNGVQNNEDVTLSAAARFDDLNAGVGKTVSLQGSSLDGTANLDNYNLVLTGAPTSLAEISKRALFIDGSFTAADKVYDGNTTAQISNNNLNLLGVAYGEDVHLQAVAAFADAAVGDGKTVSLLGSSLSGTADLSNYHLMLVNLKDPLPVAQASIKSAGGTPNPTPTPTAPIKSEVQQAILNLANPPVATVSHTPPQVIVTPPSSVVPPVSVDKPAVVAKNEHAAPPAASVSDGGTTATTANDGGDAKVSGKKICAQNVTREDGSQISITCAALD